MLGTPLKPQYRRGFVYSDGWVDDARLVLLNALDARVLGTADVELAPAALTVFATAQIEASEIDYSCEQASRYFARPLTPADVVWSHAGVWPRLDDSSGDPFAVTRDYLLEPDAHGAPLLSVWGGKITTLRKLAEDAADLLGCMLKDRRATWAEKAYLSGGDLRDWIGAAI